MKKKTIMIIGIIIILILGIGVSFAYWMMNLEQRDQNLIASDCFQMSFDGENAIQLQNAYPIPKKDLETDFFPTAVPYHFTITNICSNVAHASINIETLPVDKKINDDYIDVILYPGEEKITENPTILSNASYKLTSNQKNPSKVIQEAESAYHLTDFSLNGKEKKEFNLLLFLDEDTPPMQVSNWKGKITINSFYEYQYSEEILNGAIPDLSDGKLVPVVIYTNETPSDVEYSNEENKVGGRVEKADITDTRDPWYSYKDKKWANAVILRDGLSDTYQPGDEIPESDIESYFVWIPRYKYRLKEDEKTYDEYTGVINIGNKNSVSEFYNDETVKGNKALNNAFEIEFENNTIKPSEGKNSGDWQTHPAFVAFNSNGFWVGKFETGYLGANNKTAAQVNQEEPSKVIIKPSVYSWRNINVSNAFYTSYNYKRELESHMMKNSEWGAVAYLTQSKYGRCDGNNGPCEEVRINNNSNFITGYSAKNEPTVGEPAYNSTDSVLLGEDGNNGYQYYNSSSVQSSTTGNYYGVYDMSGGAYEYVMGVIQGEENNKVPASGRNSSSNSGFKGPYSYCQENGATNGEICGDNIENKDGLDWPSSKYYDLYDYSISEQQYQRGILGDATKEFGPIYSTGWPRSNGSYYSRYLGSYNADLMLFVRSSNPWFGRGAAYAAGTDAGIGAFDGSYGSMGSGSFRVILTP